MARSSLFPPSVQPGKPILPPCPPGWTTVTFGDVLDIVERPIDLVDGVEYQLVTAKRSRGGVVARSRLLGRDVLTKTQFLIERDDFLMSNRQIIHGGCGIVPPALDGAVVSNEYSVLRPNFKLLLEFLGYLSHSIYFQQTCFHASVGVDVEKMIFDCERWLEFKIHLPPLHEQRRIAEILSSVDYAIAATRAVIEQTRTVKRGVLEHLLTKGIGHTRFKQTEIGDIPEGWDVKPLSGFGKVYTGKTPSTSNDDYWGGNILFVTPGDLSDDAAVVFGSDRCVSEDGARQGRIMPAGAVTVTCIGSTIGKTGILRKPAMTNQQMNTICCSTDVSLFVYEVCVSLRSHLQKVSGKQAVPIVNKTTFENIMVAHPPLDEQIEISRIAHGFQEALVKHTEALRRLDVLKSALMSDLLTGRKRVTDSLPLAAE